MAEGLSNSLFKRYQPAIYVLAGVLVAYGTYVTYLHSSKTRTQTGLHRSNAVRRPRRAYGRQQSDVAGPEGRIGRDQRRSVDFDPYASPDVHLFIGNWEVLREGAYGTITRANGDGPRIRIELEPDNLPTVERFRDEFGHGEEEARRTRAALEHYFLDRYFRVHYGPEPHFDLEDTVTDALRAWLASRGFSTASVTEVMESFNTLRTGDAANHTSISLLDQEERDADAASMSYESDHTLQTSVPWQPTASERNQQARDGQNLKSMLYYIAEEQARQEGYIHRGVTCNSCDAKPIRGVRWRCANCPDYDLCSDCEAINIHPRTHIFYKVKIPAPFLGNPRQAQPVLYPGHPEITPFNLPTSTKKKLIEDTDYEASEMEALWDQFTCLANVPWLEDPNKLGAAIDRRAFDKSFVPHSSISSPTPNLIYDRMFAFYDADGNDLIGFEEFIKGLACLRHGVKLLQVFNGYDMGRRWLCVTERFSADV